VRFQKRHEAILERMTKKHAREVQIEVEKETVQIAGELKVQTRIARQAEAEVKRVMMERGELQSAIKRAVRDKNESLKRIGRERRQHDVDVREWKEKCDNLEASVRLREKQEQGKERQHKVAMSKAEDLCTTLKTRMKLLDKQEGQLRYLRAKARRQLDIEKDAVNILKSGVQRKQCVVVRQEEINIKRRDALIVDEATLGQKREKLGKDKLVWPRLVL
jgi:hypothetical protein